uniref:Uncharacterized protein n=1 Tax=Attheya septentrionalis TaxID=420275 RepID=A0A7S2U6A6_9STRA
MATKIPPHVAREMRRHIQPAAKKVAGGSGGSGSSSSSSGKNTMRTLAGLVVFTGATASIPYWALKWIRPLNARDEALTHAQIRRGAFNNSGSRDAGKDPMWDFKTGSRIQDQSYVELFAKDDPNQMDHGDKFVHQAKQQQRR